MAQPTLHKGNGQPDDRLGKDGDFYLDLQTMQLYGPKDGGWRLASGRRQAPEQLAAAKQVGDELVIPLAQLRGAKGDKGDSVQGPPGRDGMDGVGIRSIEQQGNQLIVQLSDGAVKLFDLPAGQDGVGIQTIDQRDAYSADFILTNGKIFNVPLPAGRDGMDGTAGREVELRNAAGLIQWRYKGDADWRDLFRIPSLRGRAGGGGAHKLNDLDDVNVSQSSALDVLVYDAASGKYINRPIADLLPRFQNVTASADVTEEQNNTSFRNTGAGALCVMDLPPAREGLRYTFTVTGSYGFKLDADGSDTIRLAGSISSAGGTMQSTKIGSSITIEGMSGGWYATSALGTWIEA